MVASEGARWGDRGGSADRCALLWLSDADGRCAAVNEEWLAWRGRPAAAEFGGRWLDDVHPDDADRCWGIYLDRLARRLPFAMEVRLRRADGEFGRLLAAGASSYAGDGIFTGVVIACQDITDRPASGRVGPDTGEFLHRIATSLSDGVLTPDEIGGVIMAPSPDETPPEARVVLVGTARGGAVGRLAHFIEDDGLDVLARGGVSRREVPGSWAAQSRAGLVERARAACDRPARAGRDVAVVLLLLANYETVASRLGVWTADEMARSSFGRAARILRSGDTVAMLGRDEIGVVLDGVTGRAGAAAVAEIIRAAMVRPTRIAGNEVTPDVRIALVVPGAGEPVLETLERLDEQAREAAGSPPDAHTSTWP